LSTSCFHAPFPLRTLISFPQNANPPRNAQQKKRKEKHKKNIEGYINSYIQKSKKEAKARTRKKQGSEGGMMKPPSNLEEIKTTGASPVELVTRVTGPRYLHKRAPNKTAA
jgi:hypothetical protein